MNVSRFTPPAPSAPPVPLLEKYEREYEVKYEVKVAHKKQKFMKFMRDVHGVEPDGFMMV